MTSVTSYSQLYLMYMQNVFFCILKCIIDENSFTRNLDDSMGAASMIVLIIAAIAFSLIAILIGKLLNKGSQNKQKLEPYECGIPTKGKTWMQMNVGYYLFALVFLIFDVELVFLYPWAVVAKQLGWIALIEIILFLTVLFIGFLYAHKQGALQWK